MHNVTHYRVSHAAEFLKIPDHLPHHQHAAFQPTKMATNARRKLIEKEGRILMSIDAFKRGQFKSQRAAAAAFDVDQRTISNRLRGRTARVDTPANSRKLNVLDENLLKEWIISADEQGMAPQFKVVR